VLLLCGRGLHSPHHRLFVGRLSQGHQAGIFRFDVIAQVYQFSRAEGLTPVAASALDWDGYAKIIPSGRGATNWAASVGPECPVSAQVLTGLRNLT
jgi:hypothetical protein